GSASAKRRGEGGARPYSRYVRLILHEKNWLPLIRSLGTFTAVTNAVGDRRAPAVHRPRRGGGAPGNGRSLLPCSSLRTATGLTEVHWSRQTRVILHVTMM